MNWKFGWPFRKDRSLGQVNPTAVQKSLFGAGSLPGGAPPPAPGPAPAPGLTRGILLDSPPPRPPQRSWVGVLLGQNRRRDDRARMVQGEFRLRDVKPIRNELREDDIAVIERRTSRVIWETPVADRQRDDQDLAWNRLRERRRAPVLVQSDSEP